MAIKQISWENKTGIQNDPSVARKNKVTDEDMNEIKEAINNNAHELETNLRDIQVGSEELTQRVYDVEDDCDTLKDQMLHLQQYELKELEARILLLEQKGQEELTDMNIEN